MTTNHSDCANPSTNHQKTLKQEPDNSFEFFEELPLTKTTLKAIKALGFKTLTPIQSQILPHTLANQDAIGQAQTGTGKTATFLITIIESLLKNPLPKDELRYLGEPRALILAPTRELAQQIESDCMGLTAFSGLTTLCFTGGASDVDKNIAHLNKQPTDIVIGTVGRVLDLIKRGELFLDRVEVFVLDEADRMLDMGFIPDIKRIIRRLPPKTHRQTLLFSATFNTDVMNLAYQWLYDPAFIEIAKAEKTNTNIEQKFFWLSNDQKLTAIRQLLKHATGKTIIFANRRDQVAYLHKKLSTHFNLVEMSGDVAQVKREKNLQALKDGDANILIATDVAGRGIHIDDINLVINYALPDSPDDYVHRIGRTGRAGRHGVAISLIGEDDAFLFPALEKHIKTKIGATQFVFDS